MTELAENLAEEFKDKEYADAYADEFLDTSIATQIKILREQHKLTQEKLGNLTGMKQERISVLENINNCMWSLSTLKKIAKAFDVTLRVSFEDFATRIDDITNFNRESLQRLPREEALAQRHNQVTYINSTTAQWLPFENSTLVTYGRINLPNRTTIYRNFMPLVVEGATGIFRMSSTEDSTKVSTEAAETNERAATLRPAVGL